MSTPFSSSSSPGAFVQESHTVELNGNDFCVHTWKPTTTTSATSKINDVPVSAISVVLHGFHAHGMYPTVRFAAERIASGRSTHNKSMNVMAMDYRGHGKSSGQRFYLGTLDQFIMDVMALIEYAVKYYRPNDGVPTEEPLKIFLVGSSLGGALAIKIANELEEKPIKNVQVGGMVLLAPMLKIKLDDFKRGLVTTISYLFPRLTVIPTGDSSGENQYRDPSKRHECQNDPLIPKKGEYTPVGSVGTLLELEHDTMQNQLQRIRSPYLLMVANEDYIIDNRGCEEMKLRSKSMDKTIKHYDALHGLLCEPSPLIDTIETDMLNWIHERW